MYPHDDCLLCGSELYRRIALKHFSEMLHYGDSVLNESWVDNVMIIFWCQALVSIINSSGRFCMNIIVTFNFVNILKYCKIIEDMAPCCDDKAWESRGRQRLYQKRSTILERRSQRLQMKTMSNQTLPTRTGPARKVWPTPSYHESHRKTNTGRSCWVSGFKSRPNRIAYGSGWCDPSSTTQYGQSGHPQTLDQQGQSYRITFSDLQCENAVWRMPPSQFRKLNRENKMGYHWHQRNAKTRWKRGWTC